MKGVSMAKRLLTSIVSLGFLSSVLLASPAQADAANLKGAGSSYANKFITTCAVNDPATAVTYNPGGSGSGRTAFANGTVDFGASDAAASITSWSGSRAGYTSSKFSYIPIVGGPIAVLYQIPGITTGQLRLDSLTIAKIYSGKITKWNDPAIAALQTSAVKSKLPSNPIRVVYRSASSGTSENFTDYLRQTAPSVWTKAKNTTIASGNPAGRMPAGSIGGANAQALVSSVKSTKYSIGYADLSDALSSKVPFATVKNAQGEWVAPTVAASSKFLEAFSGASGFNASTGAVTLNYTKKIAGAYNLSLVTYALADKGSTSAKAAQVEAFVKYMINTCGPDKAASIGYSPITGNLKTKALALAEAIS
jgi:phosphate transport system substrate-binding protein